jgi:hypothetical protein
MSKEIESAAEALIKNTEKNLVKNYKQALKDLRAKMALIYEKYAQEGKLTYAEMAKYNRYVNLNKAITEQLKELTGQNAKAIKTLAGSTYQESYYRQAFFFEKTVQVKLGFGLLNPDVIKAAVQNPISGLTLNQTLAKNRDAIILKIRQEVTQGLVKGEHYSKMAKRIKGSLDGDATKALRVARTEGHRCQIQGQLESGKHAADKGIALWKVWEATLDDRTRDSHASLDQVKVEVDEDFTSPLTGATGPGPGMMGDPAEDIHCRCTARMELKGHQPKKRYSREEIGKRGQVIEYTNYEDWAKAKGLKLQKV